MTSLEEQGFITTFSNDKSYTDSAAAGSALSSGVKYTNSEVAMHNGQSIQSISEYAKAMGYGVAVITTDSLYGATPAAFSAHAASRSDSESIILGQISSVCDLFMGQGYASYLPYKDQLEAAGFTFVNTQSTLDLNAPRLFACFSGAALQKGTDVKPSLKDMTEFAVAYMEKHFPNGYFIMIEGAYIDKLSHGNDLASMMNALENFDQSVQYVRETVPDASVLVTADHETGGLQLASDASGLTNDLYTTKNHTSTNVPYFISLRGTDGNPISFNFSDLMDNTDIFEICKSLLDC